MAKKEKITDEVIEELQVGAEKVIEKVKEIIHEGNVRRIVIKNKKKVIVELPMTIAAIGAVMAPLLAVAGTITALATNCTIEVVRGKKK